MTQESVSDVEGPWIDTDWESSLVARCKQYWRVPINDLPDVMVATYLQQGIALQLLRKETQRRIGSGDRDGSELYEGQLVEALEKTQVD